jgi:hypothetical protein
MAKVQCSVLVILAKGVTVGGFAAPVHRTIRDGYLYNYLDKKNKELDEKNKNDFLELDTKYQYLLNLSIETKKQQTNTKAAIVDLSERIVEMKAMTVLARSESKTMFSKILTELSYLNENSNGVLKSLATLVETSKKNHKRLHGLNEVISSSYAHYSEEIDEINRGIANLLEKNSENTERIISAMNFTIVEI